MNKNLTFEFSVDKDNNTITIRREFAAERSLVWDAWTRPEILEQWWAPKPWKARTKSMDFKEGGHWHYAMVGPNGEEHWGLTGYKTINAQEDYSGTDCFTDSEARVNDNMPQSEFRVKFTGEADRTMVENVTTYPSLEQLETTIKMGFKEGITIALDSLDEVLENLKNQ